MMDELLNYATNWIMTSANNAPDRNMIAQIKIEKKIKRNVTEFETKEPPTVN